MSLKQTRTWLLGGNIVENQPETDQFDLLCNNEIGKLPEHVMLDEEGVVGGLEDEVLHEGLRDVLVRLLKLTKN